MFQEIFRDLEVPYPVHYRSGREKQRAFPLRQSAPGFRSGRPLTHFALAAPSSRDALSARLRKKFASLALLLAWVCANGAIWDAAQLLVWGKMFSDNARVMPVAAAFQATFDPAKACELCAGVAEAKETARQQLPQSVERSAEKLLLALHTPAPILLNPVPETWPAALASAAPVRTESVPVPPPRV